MFQRDEAVNLYGEPLKPCSEAPVTGFFRDGCCNTCREDTGSHTVCAVVTREFLQYSRFVGNDLSTPHPELGFDGLAPGDSWCLCAARWLEAYENGRAPLVRLEATHIKALEIIPLALLEQFAAPGSEAST